MPRRFKESENPQKARTDWKKEQEARQPRRAPAGGRGGLLQNMMARRMGGGTPGGGGPGGGLDAMRNHPAVGFGRQMTGGVADGPSAAIRNMVMQRLASKGMSQDDTGTWQIAGLNRPSDPGLDIRNSAIAAMDPTGEMLRRVLGASPMPGGMRGMPSGLPGSGIPSPGLGAGSLPLGPQNGMPLPPVFPSGGPGIPGTSTTSNLPGTVNGRPFPAPPGGGMQSVPPGLPGGPPMTPGTGGPVPSPGLGGGFPNGIPEVYTPSKSLTVPSSPPFPPQGQGVGRTTTPTGAEIDPGKYPTTNTGGMAPGSVPGAQTGVQGRQNPTTPGLGGGSPAGFPVIAPPPTKPSMGLPPAGVAGGLNSMTPPASNGGYMSDARRAEIAAEKSANAQMTPVGGMIPGVATPTTRMAPTNISPTSDMVPAGLGGTGDVRPGQSVPMDQQIASLSKQFPPPGAPAGSMPPPSVANDIYRQPGAPTAPGSLSDWPNMAAPKPPVPPPSGPPPGPLSDWPNQGASQMQGYANPGGPLTQRLQQGRPGTPPAPGRAPTPMVPAGAMPGQSTPFNPAQMAQQGMKLPAIPRPTGFGTPGQTQAPGARQPVSLANLGQSIQATVASRVGAAQQGIRPGVSPATPGSPVGNSLDDLGDRIRAAVAGNNGNVQPAAPGAGGTNLGQATTSIMDRVRQQLSQAGMPAGGRPQAPMTNGTTPFPTTGSGLNVPTAPGAPSTGMMQGGAPVPPGGVQPMAAPSTAPAPSTTGGVGAPQGTISCGMGFGCGGNWSDVNQYDASFAKYGAQYGVDPAMLKAMAVIESGGQSIPNQNGFPNYGIMQLTSVQFGAPAPTKWDAVANKLGVDISSPDGQIAIAAYVLGGHDGDAGSPEDIFLSTYYPTPCLDCAGQDGNTPRQYLDSMHSLMGDINAAGGGTTQAVDPTTGAPVQLPPGANSPINGGGPLAGEPGAMDPAAVPGSAVTPAPTDTGLIPGMDAPRGEGPNTTKPAPTNVVYNPGEAGVAMDPNYVPGGGLGVNGGIPNMEPRAIMSPESLAYLDLMGPGAAQSALDGGYGFGAPDGCVPIGSCYDKFWGWDPTQHPGLDISMGSPSAPAEYSALTSGTVVCVGANGNFGNPSQTSGCGGSPDTLYGGPGTIKVLDDYGAVITYGHTSSTGVQGGQKVSAGQPLGMTGSMTGPNGHHVHLEVQLPIGPPDGNGNPYYVLVDPNVYFNGGYCDRGFCPLA